jgi:ribosomal protein S18 acetylase RimI-like enzyme
VILFANYFRALGMLSEHVRVAMVLSLANLAIAAVQICEAVLFGLVVDALATGRPATGPILTWAALGLFSIVASVAVALGADRLAHRNRLHVLNLAVARSHRRLGIGGRMMEKLAGKLSPDRRSRIVLEVRERNLPAQLFFRSQRFLATSVLKDFYQDTTEDAYLMQYNWQAAVEEMPVERRLAG